MKSLKALALPIAIFAGVSTAVAASVVTKFTVQDVNTKVQQLVAPFNNATTKMELAFTKLNIDDKKTLDFGFTGLVSKVGSVNEAKLEFRKAQYAYGDGTKPTVDLDVVMAVDLVKAFGQDMINGLADDLDSMAVDFAKDFAKDYGSAATISAKTVDKVVDAKGNVQKIQIHLNAVIDLQQLPATKELKDVEAQEIDLVVSATTAGLELQGKFVANPKYKGFEQGEDGLKEYVEKLLIDDAKTYDDLNRYLAILDSGAAWLAEMKP